MDTCRDCLAFDPLVQRNRFVRHLLWRKRAEATGENLPTLPPKTTLSISDIRKELACLGVPEVDIEFYTTIKNYTIMDELDESSFEPDYVEGMDLSDGEIDSALESPSKVSIQDARGTTPSGAPLASLTMGNPTNLLHGGRDPTESLAPRTTSAAGSRFGHLLSLKKPKALGAVEPPSTRRGLESSRVQVDQVDGSSLAGISGQLDRLTDMMSGFSDRLGAVESARPDTQEPPR